MREAKPAKYGNPTRSLQADRAGGGARARRLSLKAPPATAFGVNEKDRAWVDSKCTPQPTATFLEKAVYTGGRETYIRATTYANPSFVAALARTRANPAWKTYELNTGHDVMVDSPERLTEILLEVA